MIVVKMDGKKRMAASKSKSSRAGLKFPVGRISRLLRKGRYAPRVGNGAAVYLTSVLEYMAAELLEISGTAAHQNKCKRITPQHIQLAVSGDVELAQFLPNVDIFGGGVIPFIHPAIVPKKKTMPRKIVKNGFAFGALLPRSEWSIVTPAQ